MVKNKTTVYPQKKLSYHEWIESLKDERKVFVSSLYKGRSIEERVAIDEARQYKIPQSLQVKKTGILFGVKNLLGTLNGMVRLPNLFGKEFKF
jgi:hypothetical protein